jgi:hypothetical protein
MPVMLTSEVGVILSLLEDKVLRLLMVTESRSIYTCKIEELDLDILGTKYVLTLELSKSVSELT